MPGSETLYLSSSYKVLSSLPTDDYVVICFDGWYPDPTLDDPPFGYEFLKSEGMNVIGIKSAVNDWYQNREIQIVLDLIHSISGNRRRRGYGVSMGGYAAINFSEHLKIDWVVIGSPQFSVDPAKVPFESRWPREREAINFVFDRVSSVKPVAGYALFDPHEKEDREHVRLIQERHPIRSILLPFGGHSIFEFLSYSKCVRSATGGLLRRTMSDVDVVKLRRAGRDGNRLYWTNRSSVLSRASKNTEAYRSAERAFASDRGVEILARCQFAEMLYLRGETDRAVTFWRLGLSTSTTRSVTEYLVRVSAHRRHWPELLPILNLDP